MDKKTLFESPLKLYGFSQVNVHCFRQTLFDKKDTTSLWESAFGAVNLVTQQSIISSNNHGNVSRSHSNSSGNTDLSNSSTCGEVVEENENLEKQKDPVEIINHCGKNSPQRSETEEQQSEKQGDLYSTIIMIFNIP